MQQTDLFWQHKGSQPSQAASFDAAKLAESFASHQRATVEQAIRAAGERGITDRELHDQTGIELASICARRNELLKPPSKVVALVQRRISTDSHTAWRQGRGWPVSKVVSWVHKECL